MLAIQEKLTKTFYAILSLPAMMTPGISKVVSDAGDFSILFLILTGCLLMSLICWLFVKESKKNYLRN